MTEEQTEVDVNEDDLFMPSDDLVPITPQARRVGFEFPVYVTQTIWNRCISWTGGPYRHNTSPDRRIFELLDACSTGLQKKLAGSDEEDGFVYFRFKHFFWDKGRKNAKKQASIKIGCRIFLDPEKQAPWILLFDPDYDYSNVLKKGEVDGSDTDVELQPTEGL